MRHSNYNRITLTTDYKLVWNLVNLFPNTKGEKHTSPKTARELVTFLCIQTREKLSSEQTISCLALKTSLGKILLGSLTKHFIGKLL